MFRLLARWGRTPRRAALSTPAALATFLAREASLISQKSVVGYCLVKTSLPLNELTREEAFAAAYEAAQRTAFEAVLADLIVIVEGQLRTVALPPPSRLARALAEVYRAAVVEGTGGAGDPASVRRQASALYRRLRRAQRAPVPSIREIAEVGGDRLFEGLPIHSSLRRADRESVVAGVQFLTVSRMQRLDERLDAPALCAALLGAAVSEPVPAAVVLPA